ncbi:MAG TPA: hypothetical protein VHD32_05280 [Candidatus Didemnitutus sp.]|nr:hypothetical protein [Candidatus Didemnitutus sp.]
MRIRFLCILPLLLGAIQGRADALPERELQISAPSHVRAGAQFEISVHVATRVGGGEQIGFFHGEFSADGGKNWTGFSYDQGLGPETTRHATLTAGPAASRVLIRVRIAFRDGAAGDVDYSGAAIRWSATWEHWDEPPARSAVVLVDP